MIIDYKEMVEDERCFLGSLLYQGEVRKVETRLQPDDFYSTHYRRVFETMLKQLRESTTPTIQTLCGELSKSREDKNHVPADLIAELTHVVPSDANTSHYENKILEASKTRVFINALDIAKGEADNHIDTDTIIKNLIPALAGVTTARNEAGIKTAAELLKTQFPEIRWIVPGLIGEGLTLICGAPKIGKSWLVLNLAISAASGGGFLGALKAEKTDTLYLALEDTERRIHSRLKKLKAPETDNLKITTQWRDGYTGLEYYLKANAGIGLVIIDTLARFANIEDFNAYAETTAAMARLKRIADDLNIAVILIHHAKKTGNKTSGADWMESTLGSTGLTGATDSTIFISRDRSDKETKNTATLYATGRDAADITKHLKLDLGDAGVGWAITDKREGPENTNGAGNGETEGNGSDFDWSAV